MGHMLQRMHSQGVMRCSPLGIVASIAGHMAYNGILLALLALSRASSPGT